MFLLSYDFDNLFLWSHDIINFIMTIELCHYLNCILRMFCKFRIYSSVLQISSDVNNYTQNIKIIFMFQDKLSWAILIIQFYWINNATVLFSRNKSINFDEHYMMSKSSSHSHCGYCLYIFIWYIVSSFLLLLFYFYNF